MEKKSFLSAREAKVVECAIKLKSPPEKKANTEQSRVETQKEISNHVNILTHSCLKPVLFLDYSAT